MRFQMRNCIKYAQQCQNGIFEKTFFGQERYPKQLYGSLHSEIKQRQLGNQAVPNEAL